MASGSRLTFLDPAALRSIYPGTGSFSTEFMFRSPSNLFSTVQFVPERVVEFSISPEGIRFYKVQWQETWLPEHHLLQYQNLIELFWRNQNELTASCETNNQSSSSTPTSDIAKSIKDDVNGAFLTALQPEPVQLEQATINEERIETDTVTNELKPMDEHQVIHETNLNGMKQKYEIIVQRQDDQNVTHGMESDVNQITIEYNDVVLNLPNSQIPMDVALDEAGNHIMHIPGDNELTKVMSPRFKKSKSSSLQLEGFELANIENPSATEEELRMQAREVLSSFRRKRVRFPNGSSKLPQTCFFCTKVLSNRKKLREHQFSIHFKNVGEFLCGICQQRFIFRRQLKAHMITHSDNRNYVCKLCGLTCKRRSHLHKHMDTHQKERNYRCDVCHKNFKVQAELKDHCLLEHKNQTSKCNVCKQTLHTAYSVYIHSMRHSGTRDHICQVCGATFKRKQHLIAHRKVHENATENIKCPACDKEFPEKKYFRKHLEQFHKELAPNYRYDYICTICDKDFAYKGRLDEHMKIHAEETEEERNARTRKKKVDTMSEDALNKLSDQVEKITNPKSGEIKLRCKLCRRREFRLISTMEKHLEDHRAGYKFMKSIGNFECEICKKTFHSEARLVRHNIVHQPPVAKATPFQCKKCKKSFKWKSCLQAHAKKCAPISKGAGKRKATLKAKEKLRRQIEDASSGDEMHVVHVDHVNSNEEDNSDDDNDDEDEDDEDDEDEDEDDEDDEDVNDNQEGKMDDDPSSSEILPGVIETEISEVDVKEQMVCIENVSAVSPRITSHPSNLIIMESTADGTQHNQYTNAMHNIISVTHQDNVQVSNKNNVDTDAESIYVITVRPNNIMEVTQALTSPDEFSNESYQLSGSLQTVEANVGVETVIHGGDISLNSVEIESGQMNS